MFRKRSFPVSRITGLGCTKRENASIQTKKDKNAENVLFIRSDRATAKAYSNNWRKRAAVSEPLEEAIESGSRPE